MTLRNSSLAWFALALGSSVPTAVLVHCSKAWHFPRRHRFAIAQSVAPSAGKRRAVFGKVQYANDFVGLYQIAALATDGSYFMSITGCQALCHSEVLKTIIPSRKSWR
jgi:hypothetical protein